MINFIPISDYFWPPKQITENNFEIFIPFDCSIRPATSYIVNLQFKTEVKDVEKPFEFIFKLDYSLSIQETLSCINYDFFNLESKDDSICLYNHCIPEQRNSFNYTFGDRNTKKIKNGTKLGNLILI